MRDDDRFDDDRSPDPGSGEDRRAGGGDSRGADEAGARQAADETAAAPAGNDSGDEVMDEVTDTGRRHLMRALAGVPFLGALGAAAWAERSRREARRRAVLDELGVSGEAPAVIEDALSSPPGERLRIGIIGYGGEGQALVRACGFATPEWTESAAEARRQDPRNRRLQDFLAQDDLNVELTGVCDVFDVRAEAGIAASQNPVTPRSGSSRQAVRYHRYTDMLESGEVDAVLIATPDHWHSRMTIDAAAAGVHVYCEKAMTRVEEEVLPMVRAVKDSGIVFQLGHQNRQTESHFKAREVVAKQVLGPITLVETTTNRNSPWGAWVWDIHPEGSPETIDWQQFQETAGSQVPFSLERFFRWRCWFDYGTGLSGDLMSHEYDAVNQILDLGIPRSCVATGGIYFYKDGRDVPDVFQAAFEYPDRDLTLLYSATLASNRARGKVFMGHDAVMEVGSSLRVYADSESTRYEDLMEAEIVDPDRALLTYRPGFKGVDAVTSATEEYFASRGLLFTYRGGRRVSPHVLHIGEWLDAIRNGGDTSCNIDRGMEEAITCHMATRSYMEGRKVTWDPAQQRIV